MPVLVVGAGIVGMSVGRVIVDELWMPPLQEVAPLPHPPRPWLRAKKGRPRE